MAMSPASNVDRVVALLRQRLEERERLQRSRTDRPQDSRSTRPADGIGALASLEGANENVLRRAFIQTLLADQFGKAMINDAQFQQVVERVTEAIDADPAAADLLARLVGELHRRGTLFNDHPDS